MTKVRVEPGVCGQTAVVQAVSEDGMTVKITVESPCAAIQGMMASLGEEFDAYELCLARPGANALYEYAAEKLLMHAGCPVLAGIAKCAEVECRLALPKDAAICFIKD